MSSPQITAGDVPVGRSSQLFHPQTSVSTFHPHYHNSNKNQRQRQGQRQRQDSLGSMGNAMTMSPPGGPIPFSHSAAAQNWFGTRLNSAGSSYGHSPVFRDLVVSPSSSTSHLDGVGGVGRSSAFVGDVEEAQQSNLQEIYDKRRRRRESHNAVERRRRDNINERIQDLCQLLPDHMLDNAPTSVSVYSAPGSSDSNVNNNSIQRAVNKGTILKLSVDHIKELQSEVSRYESRVRELEQMTEELRQQSITELSPKDKGLSHDDYQLSSRFQQQMLPSPSLGVFHISPDQLTRQPHA